MNLVYFVLPYMFTCLAIIFSGLSLFISPSRTTKDYLLELNLENANFTLIANLWPPRQVYYNGNLFKYAIYKFGLWGYCAGSRDLTDIKVGSFLEGVCSPKVMRYDPEVYSLLTTSISLKGNDSYMTISIPSNFPKTGSKSRTAFNSLLGGFVVSALNAAHMLIGLPLLWIFPRAIHGIFICWFILGLIQWICLIVGMTNVESLYNSLLSFFETNNQEYAIHAVKGDVWYRFGWVAMSMAPLNFVSVFGGALMKLYFRIKEKANLESKGELRELTDDEK
jgi:hypothetical protein